MIFQKRALIVYVLLLMILLSSTVVGQIQSQSTESDSVTQMLLKMRKQLKKATVDDLDWMAGTWESNDRQSVTDEYWMQPSGTLMIGVTRSISESEPLSFKYLRIQQTDSGIVYIIQPSSGSSTEFKLVELEAEVATFANPICEFPSTNYLSQRDRQNSFRSL